MDSPLRGSECFVSTSRLSSGERHSSDVMVIGCSLPTWPAGMTVVVLRPSTATPSIVLCSSGPACRRRRSGRDHRAATPRHAAAPPAAGRRHGRADRRPTAAPHRSAAAFDRRPGRRASRRLVFSRSVRAALDLGRLDLAHDGAGAAHRRPPGDLVLGIERVREAGDRIDDRNRRPAVTSRCAAARRDILLAPRAPFAVAIDPARRLPVDAVAVGERLAAFDDGLGGVRRALHGLLERHARGHFDRLLSGPVHPGRDAVALSSSAARAMFKIRMGLPPGPTWRSGSTG